ncbi:hypothetical protein DPMN_074241 [Dreissena polymorpha]|uniref:Uncharacterized protein n=1 Tax=Dreissena polymorpha TaxID=45954 RepID=A0A9D4BLG8_DREPO|nr:hypothetical protein DPMN_074241 [Dreissena polymorpha]
MCRKQHAVFRNQQILPEKVAPVVMKIMVTMVNRAVMVVMVVQWLVRPTENAASAT